MDHLRERNLWRRKIVYTFPQSTGRQEQVIIGLERSEDDTDADPYTLGDIEDEIKVPPGCWIGPWWGESQKREEETT
jgi:hypothetical protein